MVEKLPVLMQRSMTIGQQMVADAMPQIQKQIQTTQRPGGQQMADGALGAVVAAVPDAPLPTGAVRIDRHTAEANLLHKVDAQYPPLAVQAGVRGDVDFTITIDAKGHVANVQLVRGHPLLVKAARDAVVQWTYSPILRDGEPVTAVATVTVTFR